jgi:DNA replication protein DnaC
MEPGPMDLDSLLSRMSGPRACKCGKTVCGPFLCDDCHAREAKRQSAAQLAELRARIPPRYRWAGFGVPELEKRADTTALRVAQALKAAPWIILRGNSGAGKTSIAAALAADILDGFESSDVPAVKRALGLRWYSSHQLSKARAEHGLGRGEAPDVDLAITASVLVLDELGSERFPDVIGEILFARHDDQRGKQTILTTWLTPEAFAIRYGGGIKRRIFDEPNTAVIEVMG